MTMLVTLAQAKKHLRIDWDHDDDDVSWKIEEASAAVINYLGEQAYQFLDSSLMVVEDTSEEAIIPHAVRAATLQLLTALYENRGDDGGTLSKFQMGYLPPSVTALLFPLRDPAIA